MPTTLTLRYQKQTPYKENVFIAVADGEHPEEENGHQKLSEISGTLKNAYPDLYLPTYAADEFASIRFKSPNNGYPARKFYPGSLYEVSFVIKKKVGRDDKVYVNAFIDRARLVSKAAAADDGEELEL